MSSLSTFVNMFEQFLSELMDTFPDKAEIKSYNTKFDILKKSNPKKLLNLFIEHVGPWSDAIYNKDETLILDDKIPFLMDMKFKDIWTSNTCTDSTKNAIWAHLSSLYFFASTISSIPDGLMDNIEKLAQEYATQMKGNSVNDINPSMLIQNMQNMQGMLNGMNRIE